MRRLQQLKVPFDYPVVFSRGIFDADNRSLVDALGPVGRCPHRALVVIDSGCLAAWPQLTADIALYAARYRDSLELAGLPTIVNGGEACKNDPGALVALQRLIHDRKIDRRSYVVAVGGGALLDLAGYAAATTHRGVRLIRVPTTVLSQSDSALGLKCGVNAFGLKNFLGAFAPPHAVLIDPAFLSTLERRDLVSGMVEAVKVGLVRDASLFDWIEANAGALARGEAAPLDELVRRSAELHLDGVATSCDPFERGLGRSIDFGHWSAHKLEALSGHRLRHGEAVAIGIVLDAHQSTSAGLLRRTEFERIVAVLEQLGLELWDETLARRDGDRPALYAGIEEFRQHLGGDLSLTLLAAIGRGHEVHTVDEARLAAALTWCETRAGRAREARMG